jgi:hypothetical protein
MSNQLDDVNHSINVQQIEDRKIHETFNSPLLANVSGVDLSYSPSTRVSNNYNTYGTVDNYDSTHYTPNSNGILMPVLTTTEKIDQNDKNAKNNDERSSGLEERLKLYEDPRVLLGLFQLIGIYWEYKCVLSFAVNDVLELSSLCAWIGLTILTLSVLYSLLIICGVLKWRNIITTYKLQNNNTITLIPSKHRSTQSLRESIPIIIMAIHMGVIFAIGYYIGVILGGEFDWGNDDERWLIAAVLYHLIGCGLSFWAAWIEFESTWEYGRFYSVYQGGGDDNYDNYENYDHNYWKYTKKNKKNKNGKKNNNQNQNKKQSTKTTAQIIESTQITIPQHSSFQQSNNFVQNSSQQYNYHDISSPSNRQIGYNNNNNNNQHIISSNFSINPSFPNTTTQQYHEIISIQQHPIHNNNNNNNNDTANSSYGVVEIANRSDFA